MASGGISPSGRVLRFVLWRLPVRTARYSAARYMAAATVEGRQVLALVGFGAWVAVFWYAAKWLYANYGLLAPLQVASLFALLLIWRVIGLLRRWWVQRRQLVSGAVGLQRQREMYQMQREGLDRLRQLPAAVGRQARDGGVDVLGKLRGPTDPVTQEFRQRRRDQDTEVRGYLPKEIREDMPLGQEFGRWYHQAPRWMQRRWRRQEKGKGE